MQAEITIRLVPDETLTESDLSNLVAKASEAGQTPQQFIGAAIKAAIGQPKPHPAVAKAKRAAKKKGVAA